MFIIFPLFNFQFPYLSLLYHDDLVQLHPWCLRAGSLGSRLRFACQEFFGSALGNITCEEWKKQDWAEGDFELRCICNRGLSWSYRVCRRAGMSQLSHLGIRWLSFFFFLIPFIDQLLSGKSPWKWAQGNFFQLRVIPGEWFSWEL